MFDLKDKVAVVFGGGGYLGRHFCKALLSSGAVVYSCDMKSAIDGALKKKYAKKYNCLEVDATCKKDLSEIKKYILARSKKVDVLVNSTTMKGKDFYLPFEKVSLEGWNTGLKGDLTIPFLTSQAFIPVMKKQQSGSIINIASIYGIVGNDQRIYEGSNLRDVYSKSSITVRRIFSHGVYNAAKGGVISFTRYLAAYYGKYNVRVNCITPGGIYHKGENKSFVKKYSARTPLGRKANPDEINGAVIFLASDASSYVTGHNLVVDGGYTIW